MSSPVTNHLLPEQKADKQKPCQQYEHRNVAGFCLKKKDRTSCYAEVQPQLPALGRGSTSGDNQNSQGIIVELPSVWVGTSI